MEKLKNERKRDIEKFKIDIWADCGEGKPRNYSLRISIYFKYLIKNTQPWKHLQEHYLNYRLLIYTNQKNKAYTHLKVLKNSTYPFQNYSFSFVFNCLTASHQYSSASCSSISAPTSSSAFPPALSADFPIIGGFSPPSSQSPQLCSSPKSPTDSWTDSFPFLNLRSMNTLRMAWFRLKVI